MRRSSTARFAAVVLAAALGLGTLAACSGGSAGDGTTPSPDASAGPSSEATPGVDAAADEAALAGVTVTGDAGAKPTITLPSTPFTVTSQVARLVDQGDGDALAAGSVAQLHILEVSGADGAERGNTWDAAQAQPTVVDPTALFPQLYELLAAAKVGSRILLAAPTTDGTGSVVDLLEVQGVIPVDATRAEGSPVAPAANLPAVTLDDTGKPTLATPTGDAPTSLVVQELIHGAGPAVAAGQTVVVKYTGWLWDGTQFDSSWDSGRVFPVANVGQAQVIAGWNQGLVGLTVGSQAMLVIPPDLGYGASASGPIPANSTLVFVVDVLAAG